MRHGTKFHSDSCTRPVSLYHALHGPYSRNAARTRPAHSRVHGRTCNTYTLPVINARECGLFYGPSSRFMITGGVPSLTLPPAESVYTARIRLCTRPSFLSPNTTMYTAVHGSYTAVYTGKRPVYMGHPRGCWKPRDLLRPV